VARSLPRLAPAWAKPSHRGPPSQRAAVPPPSRRHVGPACQRLLPLSFLLPPAPHRLLSFFSDSVNRIRRKSSFFPCFLVLPGYKTGPPHYSAPIPSFRSCSSRLDAPLPKLRLHRPPPRASRRLPVILRSHLRTG
jgi:hypothetical protein